MLDHPLALRHPNWRRLLAVSSMSVLMLGAGQAGALPRMQPGPAPGLLLVQGETPDSKQAQEDSQAALAELNKVLEATRAKLEELIDASVIKSAATELRQELQALKQENERLDAELQQASARSTELESSNELAQARIAELSKAVDDAVREAARLDEALTGQVRRNQQLDGSLADADTARKAAMAEAEKTRAEMTEKLEAATDATKQSSAELADLRQELEKTRQELATASRAREQRAAQVSELEQAIELSGVEAERLKTELAVVKEQLGQAAGAAVQAERAREAASSEAESLRTEAARTRNELTAAKAEIEQVKTANAELENEIASWRDASTSAIETARQNLIMMEEKIEELNAAIDLARPEKSVPTPSPRAKEEPAEGGSPVGIPSPSATGQRPAPKPAGEIGASRGATQPTATELSMAAPAAAPSEPDRPGLTRFDASVKDLNKRALDAAGVDLFSGIDAVGEHAVHVSTTTAWASIPPAGQLSYLNSLLDYWVDAQGGEGPAVVRIVDRDGRVLLEKSWP